MQALISAYLPPTLLAYLWILHASGLYIGRENFLDAMDLATRLSGDDRVVKLFTEQGQMKELVDLIASAASSQVQGLQGKRQPVVRGKKRELGWGFDVWAV